MKISLNWLKQYIDLHESPEEIATLLTATGLEVEGIEEVESIKGGLKGLVVGQVTNCIPHPNADKLKLTRVDVGTDEPLPIVCGAPNVAEGQKVIVATVGSTLYPTTGEPFQIKKAKIRGEVSEGMICAEDEIGLGQSHDGIMVLDTQLPNGTPAAEYLQLSSDFVFEIGLTPNRADAASHMGVARDLKAVLKRELKWPKVNDLKPAPNSKGVDLSVENTEACPRYSGLTIEGVTVQESPEWLQKYLKAIGINPTNNVVDITNYVLHAIGQPMHAFDAAAIDGQKVIVKNLEEGTSFTTLDEKERKLFAEDLMICSEKGGLCIAGVFGGINSGVTEKTTTVFLESAYFSADSIRKTAQRHQLKTDAAFRYERGTDPNLTLYALKYAAQLILEIAGGRVVGQIHDIYPQPIENFLIDVSYSRINQLIGKKLSTREVDEILAGLEIQQENKTEENFTAIVPPYRVDVQREADIVEEVLRIYGYNNVELQPTLSSTFLSEFPKKDADSLQQETSRLLSGAGFNEIITNSLTKHQYAEASASINSEEDVHILNFLSEELNVMRQSLLFSGLEVLERNIKRRQTDLKLYEFGTTYHKKNNKYTEQSRLSLFITGAQAQESWLDKSRLVRFHDLSQVVYQLLNKFGIHQLDIEEASSDVFAYGISLSYRKKPLVYLGKVNPKLAKLCDVKQEVFYADFDWEALQKYYPLTIDFEPLSKYPEVKRDLSLVVDKSIKFEDIRKLAVKNTGKLLTGLRVFDVYQGDKIGANEKAYAMSFFLQDQQQTLTDKVIDKTMQRLINVFEKELKATIRR
ncbi:phenylalanine--tRNA ligase subunit beta [Roseivirga sp. UBA838]|uniref:phenylalanine--tRNA ligase subunit beta n=1 Tax=Roseivirga sp. UBA838 TaxID=1947393 RepID=UPI00257CB5D1|nr:phenylalanine--tRNA ligase subunit beta [Roseivirga sp. UBA838]|tara:strand:- start:30238 stop:32652 length:2415 start_codon:yes stop_codon:yes gene_type:complete